MAQFYLPSSTHRLLVFKSKIPTAPVVKCMHTSPFSSRSNHVMAYFGSTAKSTRGSLIVTAKPQTLSPSFTRSHHVIPCSRSAGPSVPKSIHAIGLRHLSWFAKMKSVEAHSFSHSQEEGAKAAILEKVMKGRQPTDLMLRCA